MRKISLMSTCFLGLSVILYGYLTGSTFLFAHIFENSVLYDVIILGAIFYMASGTLALLFRITPGCPAIYEWILSVLLSLMVSILATLFIGDAADIGKFVRIYISLTMFYFFLILASVGLLVSWKGVSGDGANIKGVGLVAAGSLVLGMAIYIFKTDSFSSANQNFIIQYVLCVLCLAVPMYATFTMLAIKFICKPTKS